MDEYNTSQFCPTCDQRLQAVSNREKHCSKCSTTWNRDIVGALNQLKVWTHWLEYGERPLHLRRPAATGAEGAAAKPSKKRGVTTAGLDVDPPAAPDHGNPAGPPPCRRTRVCTRLACVCVCATLCVAERETQPVVVPVVHISPPASPVLPPSCGDVHQPPPSPSSPCVPQVAATSAADPPNPAAAAATGEAPSRHTSR